MSRRRCQETVRGFGGGKSRCSLAAWAAVDDATETVFYCVEHLAANITGHVTQAAELDTFVTVKKVGS